MRERFDEHLSFDLPYGYEVSRGHTEDGLETFLILCGIGRNSEGEQTSEARVSLKHLNGSMPEEQSDLNGDFPTKIAGKISELGLGIQLSTSSGSSSSGRSLKMHVLFLLVAISCGNDTYALTLVKSGKTDAFSDNAELMAKHTNEVLGSLRLDGRPGNFKRLSGGDVERELKEGSDDAENLNPNSNNDPNKTSFFAKSSDSNVQDDEGLKRRQEEEHLRKEREQAEARRKEEEKKQKEADEALNYEKKMRAWREDCVKISNQRDAEIEKRRAAWRAQFVEQQKSLLDSEIKENQHVIDELCGEIEKEKTKLAGLGLFKFSEKKACQHSIEVLEGKVRDAYNAIEKAKEIYATDDETVEHEERKQSYTIRTEVEKEIPVPAEPEKPESMRKMETATQRANDSTKQQILDYLRDGALHTVSDINNGLALGLSDQRISALVRQLVDEGRVIKIVDKRVSYFQLA